MTKSCVAETGRLLNGHLKALAFAAPASFLLSACGGAGSSGPVRSTPPPPAQFTSFTNVAANSSVTVGGSTRELTAAVNSIGTIPPGGVSDPTEGTGSVGFTVDAQRQATSIAINGANSSVSFNSSANRTLFTDTSGRVVATGFSNASGSEQALTADPFALGFDYQSFGVWGTGFVPGGTARLGAISAGARTNGSAVPSAGNATFTGGVGGIYVDNAGIGFRYGAYATYDVNFAARSISMTTTGGNFTNTITNVTLAATAPMTAAMTYGAGSNAISGTFRLGNFMSGSGSGWFYGPAAQELGGTFFISGSAGKMIGGFGGKR